MKKLLIIGLLILVTLTGCKAKPQISFKAADDIRTMIENKETFLLYFGRSDCTACIEFKPILIDFMENHDLVVYGIESDDVKLHTKEVVDQWIADFAPSLKWTPTMFYFKDGVVVDMQSGVMDFNQLSDFTADYESNSKGGK
jgi:predicted bacteriocin transport accessory protein